MHFVKKEPDAGPAIIASEKINQSLRKSISLFEQGDYVQSVTLCEKIIQSDCNYPQVHYLLGRIAVRLGRYESAVGLFRKAIEIEPDNETVYFELGLVYRRLLRRIDAIESYRKVVRLNRHNNAAWTALGELFWNVECTQYDEDFKNDLIECLKRENIDPQNLIRPVITMLKQNESIGRYLCLMEQDKLKGIEESDEFEKLLTALSDPLMIEILQQVIIPDFSFEKLLTYTRRLLLDYVTRENGNILPLEKYKYLIYALARQCYLTDYVYFISENEIGRLKKLKDRINIHTLQLIPQSKILLTILSCYQSIADFSGSDALISDIDNNEDELFKELIFYQIIEPREREKISRNIKTIGSIDNKISKKVRAQYEARVFPRWDKISLPESQSLKDAVRQLVPALPDNLDMNISHPEILIAGCGAGRNAIITARRFENSRVLAVDLSRASLAYAVYQAGKLNISNIDFRQADILDLDRFDRRFDIIEAVGVLHHLENPFVGWQKLLGLLKPNGLMKVGLYSKIAKRHIESSRQLINKSGYQSTAEDIRAFRHHLINLPETDMSSAILSYRDFYSLSECTDLLFHVQEKSFDLSEVSEYLEKLSLEFLGFEMYDSYPSDEYEVHFPDDNSKTNLGNWDQLERKFPDIFVGMYQFWVRKRF